MPAGLRAALAVEAFRHTAAYDARIAAELPDGWPRPASICRRARPARRDRSLSGDPDDRPREGRDAALRREPAPARRPLPAPGRDAPTDGPFATGAPPLQGKALSYNNVLDASAAAALGAALRGPGLRDRQAHEPVRGRASAPTLREAWDAALAGDPVSRVRRRRGPDAAGGPARRPRA